ncbi:MAG: ribulose-phosphate 3-epimerase [Microscillaceae bacterium]|nr:ribulose-phosphate 3-epimerase [Microscillaceae bacterium]
MKLTQQTLVAPSVLACDFAGLKEEVLMLNESQADWIHLDIMDGVFVPNISFGMPVCEAIQKYALKPMDVHLMIVQPERYLERFRDLGAANLTVHYEACPHLHRTIEQIKDLGCKAGVAINPHTSIQVLEEVLSMLDLVCVMSVNPGFGGQKFIPSSLDKISRLKKMIALSGSSALIEIDGGVNQTNYASIVAAGCDVLVAGSFVFQADNPKEVITNLKGR